MLFQYLFPKLFFRRNQLTDSNVIRKIPDLILNNSNSIFIFSNDNGKGYLKFAPATMNHNRYNSMFKHSFWLGRKLEKQSGCIHLHSRGGEGQSTRVKWIGMRMGLTWVWMHTQNNNNNNNNNKQQQEERFREREDIWFVFFTWSERKGKTTP